MTKKTAKKAVKTVKVQKRDSKGRFAEGHVTKRVTTKKVATTKRSAR